MMWRATALLRRTRPRFLSSGPNHAPYTGRTILAIETGCDDTAAAVFHARHAPSGGAAPRSAGVSEKAADRLAHST